MKRYVGAIDQGTTSSRFIVFDRAGRTVAAARREFRQIFPQPGWVVSMIPRKSCLLSAR